MTDYQHFPAKFDRHIAGGRLIANFPSNMDCEPEGLVVFTSLGVPATTSWWMVPGCLGNPNEELTK